jgi:hypothetical protein
MDSKAPKPKVAAGGIAGALSILVVFAAGQFGLEIPPEVASALTVVVAFIAGYFKSE